jgi:hypothetical protein
MDMVYILVEWVSWSRGHPWPENAISAGVNRDGEKSILQYIARRSHGNSILLGFAYQCGPFYAVRNGKEIIYRDFDVLVDRFHLFPNDNFLTKS